MVKNSLFLKYLVLFFSCSCFGTVQAINASTNIATEVVVNKSSSTKSSTASSKEPVILIQSAAFGSIERDSTQKDKYIVTLNKVMPYLSYVADRPSRSVGKITLENYLQLWSRPGKNSFQNDPPNAIIHVNANDNVKNDDTAKPEYFALEISTPKYDKTENTLVYQGSPLTGEGSALPDTATFNHITIIIDDVCIGCWN